MHFQTFIPCAFAFVSEDIAKDFVVKSFSLLTP